MNTNSLNSPAWIFFSYANFAIALSAMLIGVLSLDVPLTTMGFLGMGVLFITSAAFNLAKVLRDEHEAKRFHNRIEEAKTERLLRDVEAA